MTNKVSRRRGSTTLQRSSLKMVAALFIAVGLGFFWNHRATADMQAFQALSAPFPINILTPPGEAPFELRFFTTAVKTDSQGGIIDGSRRDRSPSDPVKDIVGAEAAGERGGLMRFTRIMFGANYFDGRPDTRTRINPNNPVVTDRDEHWPHADQPFRSWPNALALTPDGKKLYVTLPGREGYPDWRVAVVDAARRAVLRWVDLRPPG